MPSRCGASTVREPFYAARVLGEGDSPREDISGVEDAEEVLDVAARRRLIERGLQTAQASVRRTALDRLCELEGPAKACGRARGDTNAAVRKWRPRLPEPSQLPSLLGS